MFHLGESQELYVVKEVGFGIYLGEEENATEKVLLPKKEVPEGIKAGDTLEVFLYKDSQDRLIATTRTPKVRLGETAVLRGYRKNRCISGLGTGKGSVSSI